MLRVLGCITDQHNYLLLSVAILNCVVGCWLTVKLYERIGEKDHQSRLIYGFMPSIALGAAIWTTHFLAMAAYQPGVPHSYDPGLTFLFLVIAVISAWIGFGIAMQSRIRFGAEIGGAVVGLGISAMHYAGMQAFLIAGRIEWDGSLVIASLVFGTSFGSLSLSCLSCLAPATGKHVATLFLALGVVAMHLTGMGAVTILPDPTILVPEMTASNSMLALISAGIAVAVLSSGFASYLSDLRASSEARRRIEHLAHTDSLTGLPNRATSNVKLEEAVAAARRTGECLTVLVFDLNRFKDVNDVFGHAAGDCVLATLGRRFAALVEAGDSIARVGGDEFVVLRRHTSGADMVATLVDRLSQAFAAPISYNGNDLEVGASFGAVVFPLDGQSPDELLTNADVAMYRAKKSGDLIAFSRFDSEMDTFVREKRALVAELGHALERGQFELHYQVQKSVETDEVAGFEALVRWRHPMRGLVPPAKFIPLAEEAGLIIRIGEWVLQAACREAASWQRPLKIAVNLSPVQLKQGDLPGTVLRVLMQTGLAPGRLELEITESTIIEDFDRVLTILRRLKALGVGIAMDDFGTGFSSLSTLQAFAFDKIKIDRSFIEKITTRHQAAAIVRSVLSLGNDLSIPVLAEGVETPEHLDFLRQAGCDEVQGYLIGRPAPRDSIQHLVSRDFAAPGLVAAG